MADCDHTATKTVCLQCGGETYDERNELLRRIETAEDRVYSLEGVIGAVDRVLHANHAIHASRAIAIENMVQQHQHVVASLEARYKAACAHLKVMADWLERSYPEGMRIGPGGEVYDLVRKARSHTNHVRCNDADCGYEGTQDEFEYAAAFTFPKMHHCCACPKCGTTDTTYDGPEWFKKTDSE